MDNLRPFKYQVGHCLQCDTLIDPGQILCAKHLQLTPVITEEPVANKTKKKNTKPNDGLTKVDDMKENQIGYIEEYAFFEDKQKLHIIGTAFVSTKPDKYKTVRIRYRKGIYEISRNSIDTNEIAYGWPDIADNATCYTARIVNTF